MSKKNSNVNLKNKFENFKDLSKIYLNFKKKITLLKRKSFLVAVSGGPDSLALAALIKTYSYEKRGIRCEYTHMYNFHGQVLKWQALYSRVLQHVVLDTFLEYTLSTVFSALVQQRRNIVPDRSGNKCISFLCLSN